MVLRILLLLVSVMVCSAQLPDIPIPIPPLQCIDLVFEDGIDHLRCHSGQVINTTLSRTVNSTLGNVIVANKPRWDPVAAIAISNLKGGITLNNMESYTYAGAIHDKGEALYPLVAVEPGQTLLLLFHSNSHSRTAAKGLVGLELVGTRDKLVVAFDVDGNRAQEPVLRYNVKITREGDNLGHRLWYSMVGSDGWDALVEEDFSVKTESGVVMEASMSDSTINRYIVKVDSTNYA